MTVSVAGTACGNDSHFMIEAALRGSFSPPPLARGGRGHLPDVAVEPTDAAPVMVLPSLATALPLSLSSSSLISIHTPFHFFATSPWSSVLVAFASTLGSMRRREVTTASTGSGSTGRPRCVESEAHDLAEAQE